MVVHRHRGRGRGWGPETLAHPNSKAPCEDMYKAVPLLKRHVGCDGEGRSLRGRWSNLHGGHASAHRDAISRQPTSPSLTFGFPCDGEEGMEDQGPQSLDVTEPTSKDELLTASPSPLGINILCDGTMDMGPEFREDQDENRARKELEKGKSILVSLLAPKPLLINSASIRINGWEHSHSPSAEQRQRCDGLHSNLADKIMDSLMSKDAEVKGTKDSEGSSGKVDSEEEITLSHYQKEIRSEKMARRGAACAAS